MKTQRRYIMRDQVHHKVAAIMNNHATRPGPGQQGSLYPLLLLAALVLAQILLSASSA